MRQALLFDAPQPDLGGSLRDQFSRLDQETRVLLDAAFELGIKVEVLDDWPVELARVRAVNPDHLRVLVEERSRGTRRAWYRAPSAGERAMNIGQRLIGDSWWFFVAYEPRTERGLGDTGRRTDHERAKQTHWPKGATP